MRKSARAVIVLALVFAGLAALETIAAARTRAADTRGTEPVAEVAAMDDALARHDLPGAVQAWREARQLALRSRGWRAPVETAEASLRLAAATDRVRESKPTARELLLVGLFRARAEHSTDGALRVAEGFARLGDRDAAQLALRLAENVAARTGDSAAGARVRLTSDRIQRHGTDQPAAAAATASGS